MATTRTAPRFLVVNPMTAGTQGVYWASRKSANEAKEEQRLSGNWVVMTEKQWNDYLPKGNSCETEEEQRALVSKIIGYDY